MGNDVGERSVPSGRVRHLVPMYATIGAASILLIAGVFALWAARRLIFLPETLLFWTGVGPVLAGVWIFGVAKNMRPREPSSSRFLKVKNSRTRLLAPWLAASVGWFVVGVAATPLQLAFVGKREHVLFDQVVHGGSCRRAASNCICNTYVRASSSSFMQGRVFELCSDEFPRPMFELPPIAAVMTVAPHVIYVHSAEPALNIRKAVPDAPSR